MRFQVVLHRLRIKHPSPFCVFVVYALFARQSIHAGGIYAEHAVAGTRWAYETQHGYAKFHGDQPELSTWRAEVPRGACYLVISDHGNVSLYQSLGAGKSREIWGVV